MDGKKKRARRGGEREKRGEVFTITDVNFSSSLLFFLLASALLSHISLPAFPIYSLISAVIVSTKQLSGTCGTLQSPDVTQTDPGTLLKMFTLASA